MKPAGQVLPVDSQAVVVEGNAGMRYPMLMQASVPMLVKIPLPGISLRGLTAMKEGDVIVSEWAVAAELPLYASNVALSWGEFEVVDGAIAIRLTRLG
jgi:flagellar motor switch/type III secretory pathway protein FliN